MTTIDYEEVSSEGVVGCLPALLDPIHRAEIEKLVDDLPDTVNASVSDPRPLEKSTDRFSRLLNLYREQPNLLDCAIPGLLNKLLSFIQLPTCSKDKVDDLTHQSLLHVSFLNEVRGYKVLTRILPHEVTYLEKLLTTLEVYSQSRNEISQNNVLLLWLWIVIRNPFDLKRFDGNQEGVTMKRIFAVATPYLDSVHSTSTHSAALVIAQCLSRADGVRKVSDVIDEQLAKMKFGGKDTLSSLILLLAIFKHVDRSHLARHVEKIASHVTNLLPLKPSNGVLHCKSVIKLAQRIALTVLQPKVATWRYRRGKRKLDDMLLKSQKLQEESSEEQMEVEEEFDVDPLVEWAIGHVLEALSDVDTAVRWSAAKGIGRITSRLPRSYSDQVIETIIENNFDEHAGYAAHHGGCMALAELARRGFLLPHFLPAVFPVVQRSLFYEEPTRHQFGNQVRDAACYVLWAFARAYEPKEISSYIKSIATGLMCVAMFDREVNLRRAASAAFQENVGRQKNFPDGIELLTIADYFSVGNRQRCYTQVCTEVARYDVYKMAMVTHLVDYKVIHWDEKIREQAAMALEALSPRIKSMGEDFCETLVERLTRGTLSQNAFHRHGYIIAVGHLLRGLTSSGYTFESSILDLVGSIPTQLIKECDRLSSSGAMPTRKAVCTLMLLYTQAGLELSSDLVSQWMKRLIAFLRTDLQIQQNTFVRQLAAKAVAEVLNHYVSKGKSSEDLETYEQICSSNLIKPTTENERIGLCMLAESFPSSNVSSTIFDALRQVITRKTAQDKNWSMAREAAVKALHKLLKGSVHTTASHVKNSFEALFLALEEYTVADKGEIGRFVRQASMEALSDLMTMDSASDELLKTHLKRLLRNLIRQSAEKIGRTRECACKAIQELLKTERTRKLIDRVEVLDEIYQNPHDFILDKHLTTLSPLFDVEEFSEDVIRGLIVSSGGISEGNEKFGKMTLLEYQKRIAQDDEKLSRYLSVINVYFKERIKTLRIVTSVLSVLPQVFLHLDALKGRLDESREVLSLVTSVKKLTTNPKCSPSLLRMCLDSLCALLTDGEGAAVNKMALATVVESLSCDIPTIRRLAAERLYENLCCAAKVDEETPKMVAASSAWLTFRRALPIYTWPVLSAGLIFVDWNHTREWKANGKSSVLEKEILGAKN